MSVLWIVFLHHFPIKIPMPLGFPLGFPMAFRPGANPLSCKKSKKSKPGAFDLDKSRGSRLVKLFCQFSWQILEISGDDHGSSIATFCLLVLRFARARYFEQMLLKLYSIIGQTSLLNLRPVALICARLRLFAPETVAIFFAPNRSQILKMLSISDLITILDTCSNAIKVQGSKK